LLLHSSSILPAWLALRFPMSKPAERRKDLVPRA
jgi:hypothetical protein